MKHSLWNFSLNLLINFVHLIMNTFDCRDPCHPRCRGLLLLETFTTELSAADALSRLPPFLNVYKDVTGDPAFSMYNLALK